MTKTDITPLCRDLGVVPVTAGPGDQGAADAAACGHLRASHADREHVIDMLKAAFVQGMLTKAELDARAGQAFASRTCAELAAVTADLPPALIITPPPRQPARARTRPPVSKLVAGAALVIPPPAMVAAASITGSDLVGQVAVMVVLVFFMAWIMAGMQMIANWHDNRSRGQLPPRPAQVGRALEGGRDGGPGNDLILSQAHRDTRARRLLGHGVNQRVCQSVPTRRASVGLCT